MNFVSKAFFIFLPLVLLVYHLLPGRNLRYRFLLLASWVFYMGWKPIFLYVILFTTIVDWISGLLIENAATQRRRSAYLWLSLISNLGFLAFYKYTPFCVKNGLGMAGFFGFDYNEPAWINTWVLPLGISFHTFQGISYTLDVYRGKIKAVRSFTDFALFVAFFPQLVAGPIVRAIEFLPQMVAPPKVGWSHLLDGLHWFLVGLFKKYFIADRLAQFVDPVFLDPLAFDTVTHRWAVLAYAAQIYCDFSGYSDMAIGTAKFFGFELPLNFNFPYLSQSITEFWKRWHISLSTWMRDYVYISFGGSRCGNVRMHFNLILTMTLCGLWHGASWNYVLWGFYNGVLLTIHRLYDKALSGRKWADQLRNGLAFQLLATLATFLMVAVGLVMVRSQSWAGCWVVNGSLVGLSASGVAQRWVPVFVPALVGMVALGHIFSGLRNLRCGLLPLPPLVRAAAYAVVVAVVVAFGPGVTKSFIYFDF